MALSQLISPVVWMKVVVFRSSRLLHSCSCSVAPWGHCCLLDSLKRGQNCRTCSGDCGLVWLLWRWGRTVEHALGTMVRSCFFKRGKNCRTCSGDCGPVCYGHAVSGICSPFSVTNLHGNDLCDHLRPSSFVFPCECLDPTLLWQLLISTGRWVCVRRFTVL